MVKLNSYNNLATELTSNITDTDTIVAVADDLTSYDTPYRMTFDDGTNIEIIEVTGYDGTDLEVERGKEGTSQYNWNSGEELQHRGTAGQYNGLVDAIEGKATLGQNDDEYNLFQALNQRVDERAETLTYDADGNLTKVEEYETDAKTNLIKETNLTYNTDGDLIEVEEIIGDTTVTETLNYDADGNLESVERSVT